MRDADIDARLDEEVRGFVNANAVLVSGLDQRSFIFFREVITDLLALFHYTFETNNLALYQLLFGFISEQLIVRGSEVFKEELDIELTSEAAKEAAAQVH